MSTPHYKNANSTILDGINTHFFVTEVDKDQKGKLELLGSSKGKLQE